MASTRDRLIETAMTMFYQNGFHAIGLDQILDEVGVTKTTFYNHFESKDDLILEVLETRDTREREEWLRSMRDKGGDDPRSQLLALFDLLDDWFHESGFRGCMFINAAAEFPSPNDPIHKAAARHGHLFARELRGLCERAGADDPDTLTKRLMLLVAGAVTARYVDLDDRAATDARDAAAVFVDHHCPPVEARPRR
jgi:AcrR family transcriptional regulator